MNYFTENIYPLGHLIIAIIELIILIFAYPFFRLSNNQAMIVLPIVLVGNIYNNIILFSGNFFGEGELLLNLSYLRFFLHYLVVPLLIVVAIELAYLSGAKWANKFLRISSWLIAFGLTGYDLITHYRNLELMPETLAGSLHYVAVNASIPIITILVNIFLLLIGIGIWVRTKNWLWLFVASLISLLGNALSFGELDTLVGSASELILELGLLLTQYDFEDELEIEDDLQKSALSVNKKCPEDWQFYQYSGYEIFVKKQAEYTICQTGSHEDGDFVRIYIPKKPYQENGKLKVITYLHGFSLCLPEFYEEHLIELVTKGYYVFFPDFQRSDYPDFIENDDNKKDKTTAKYWLFGAGILLIQSILKRDVKKKDFAKLTQKKILTALSIVFAPLFLIIGANIFYLFNREYAKNLISMITTVIASLTDSPSTWLKFAVNSTVIGWEKLCEYNKQCQTQEQNLDQQDIDFYVFGHSLGGLLALSWCYYLATNSSEEKLQKFKPKQIITGDPAPNTALGIPSIALWILRIFRFPFATQPMDIKETGSKLDISVGILHGIDDKIVKATAWVNPPLSQEKGSFFSIASLEKKIYFSESNKEKNLTANHNQAVTNTDYYGDGFMNNFGGAKDEPNAYNYQYIWYGLNEVIINKEKAHKLTFKPQDFNIVDEPKKDNNLVTIIISLLGVLGLGYFVWQIM